MHRFILLTVGLVAISMTNPVNAQNQREVAELTMRVDRLEAQIRELTGQIDRLLFALENQGERAADVPAPLGSAPQPVISNQLEGSATMSGGLLQQAPGASPNTFSGGLSDQNVLGENGGPLDLSALIENSNPTFEPNFSDTVPNVTPSVAAAPITSSDPRQAYDIAYGHVLRGDYDAAERGFSAFLQAHPEDPLIGDANFWLGEVKFVREDYRGAATQFLDTYSRFPQSAKAPDSLLKLGLSLKELGEREAACATYAELVRKYPAASPPVKDRVRQERQRSDCI